MKIRASRFALVALPAVLSIALICTTARGATAVRSSAHFRITYQSDKAGLDYVKFILKESERSWTAIFTTLGYKKPAWITTRIAAGGKIMLSLREMTYLGYATYYWNNAKVMTNGKIAFNFESKFKDRAGKTKWHLLRGTCAHELFHLVQGGYDIVESKWLKEATAVWMEAHAFPTESKAHPTRYGFRRFLGDWNRKRRIMGLMAVGDNHEYAASIFFHYLTEHDSRGKGLIKALWVKAGAVKGDTTAKSIGEILGDSGAWGANALKRVRGLSLTDLIRSSKRHKSLSLASLIKGPYFTPTMLSLRGLTVPDSSGEKLRTVGRNVAKLSFDCINIVPDPLKIGSPVDIVLAARGVKTDGAWEFHVVKAPKRGTWKVKRFKPPAQNKWTTIRVPFDFRKEKLFFVATRVSPTSNDKYRLTGMVITPPVVESFEVHAPPAPGNARLGLTTPPPGGRELAWAVKRARWRSPVSGTAWRTEISPQTGIAYNPDNTAEIRIVLNRPVSSGGLKLKLGSDLSPALTPAGTSGRKFRARVKIKSLKSFLDGGGQIPVEIRGTDRFDMGLDGRPWTAARIDFKGTDTPKFADIKKWEGGESPFVKPGGLDNLGGRKIPIFRPKKPRPEIVLVKFSRSDPAEVFYHSEKGNFRPITGGKVDLEIAFATPMDGESAEIKFRGLAVTGEFKTSKTWTGAIDLPKDGAAKGIHPLSIQAKTTYGTAVDIDPDTEGDQPDTTHRVVVDGIPTYIEKVEVYGMGEKFYEASWTGGADLQNVENLSVAKIGDQRRSLKVRTTKDLPAEGKGTLQVLVRSSQPLSGAPSILLGSVPVVKVTGDDAKKIWQGEVSLEAIRAAIKPGQNVPIAISATDIYSNQLDADPRTVPALATERPWWRGYESKRGGTSQGYGGTDMWHEIGPAPRASFVIILDASGSMNDNNRMVNAKAGIKKLLDIVPKGVELAIVIFQGSSNRAVGFTTDVDKIRAALDGASAGGGTPLAAAIASARKLLESSSHPMSRDWRYRIFSDGQETAGGNVVLETRLLDQAIARRKGKVAKKPKDKVPPPKPVAVEKIPVYPQQWSAHTVEVDSRSGFDWIWLVEMTFTEKELPDGRCYVRFESKAFGVAYGSITDADGSNKKIKWQVNSRPSSSRSKVMRATSDNGKAAIDRIRTHARAMKAKSKSMQQCRQEIQQNVEREVN
jgi:hypothetical protein